MSGSDRILDVWAMLAFGLLDWSPASFWRATPFDLVLVLQSRQRYVDLRCPSVRPLDRSGLSQLVEKLEAGH